MKTLGLIFIDSLQSVSIASIQYDDKQTREFKLQDEFSAQGCWFKTLDDVINNIKDIDFIRHQVERKNGKNIIVYLCSDSDKQKMYSLPPKIINIEYIPFSSKVYHIDYKTLI